MDLSEYNTELPQDRHLHENVIVYWQLPYLFVSLALLLFFSIILFANVVPGMSVDDRMSVLFSVAVIVVVANMVSFAYFTIHYNHFIYLFAKYGVIIRYGIINRNRRVVLYDKLQNINTHRNLVESLLKICTITLETAAGKEAGEDIIPGVPLAEREKIVTFLSQKMGVRQEILEQNNKDSAKAVEQIGRNSNSNTEDVESMKKQLIELNAKLAELQEELGKKQKHETVSKLHPVSVDVPDGLPKGAESNYAEILRSPALKDMYTVAKQGQAQEKHGPLSSQAQKLGPVQGQAQKPLPSQQKPKPEQPAVLPAQGASNVAKVRKPMEKKKPLEKKSKPKSSKPNKSKSRKKKAK